eukprot:Phypoly_transcript_03906.p1 GENE.Phypoly_transcript_03906~~Phypoly_transcript_03906.p1  ORF type:complete len:676 (+),score=80.54 Phypoly_transcript_03906:81-2108(+)
MRKRDLGILILCAFAILWSFRGEAGGYYFTESWVQQLDTTLYSNLHFPAKSEKLPKPLITDLDGDGQNEVVFATRDCTLKVMDVSSTTMSTKSTPTVKAQSSLMRTVGVRSGRRPVGLASGYLKTSEQESTQVIVVVTDGWIVMCYDHNLELLWESIPVDEVPEGYYHEEVAILIAPHPVRVGDEGIVVVGGRLVSEGIGGDIEHEHETSHIGPDKRVEREEEGFHFSYFAFDGKSGALRWKHEEGDFFSADPHEDEEGDRDTEVETFMPSHSFKQHVFSQVRHLGEVDWRTYKHHVLTHLPYRWIDGFDSSFALDRFTKKTNFGRSNANTQKDVGWNTEAIGIPNPLGSSDPFATNQLVPKRDVDKPNVVVAKVKSGIEVVHLFTGRPLCRLLLPSLQAAYSSGAYADINGDEVIDQIISSVNEPSANDRIRCLAIANTGLPPIEQLWNGTVCLRYSGAMESLVAGLKLNIQMSTTAPSFLPSTTTLGLNSIFLVSSGKINAFGPDGEYLWDVDSRANWRQNDYPVLTPIHILPNEPALHMLALGTSLSLIAPTGELLSTVRLRRPVTLHEEAPVEGAGETGTGIAGGPRPGEIWSVAPPTLGDFNNDGLADVIVVGHDGLYGYAIQKGAGSVLFPGLVVMLICVMVYALVKSESNAPSGAERRAGLARKRALD